MENEMPDVHFEYDRDTNTLKLLNTAGNLLETFQLPHRSIQYRYNKNRGPGCHSSGLLARLPSKLPRSQAP